MLTVAERSALTRYGVVGSVYRRANRLCVALVGCFGWCILARRLHKEIHDARR